MGLLRNLFGLFGWKPKVSVIYHPKRIRINKHYTKIYLPSPQPGIRDEWTKRIRTNINVKAVYNGKILPCNFKLEDRHTCRIYVRRPHSKRVLFALTLPVSDLAFKKKGYKEKGVLNVDYSVNIKKLAEHDAERINDYLKAKFK